MKSQPQDQSIKTNCKNCAFAIYDSGAKTQISCVHNRIEKFGPKVSEAYDEDKEFYVIDRLCTYYRDLSWGYTSNDIDKVKRESALSFDIILNCNNLTSDTELGVINFINSIDYYNEKINIILLHEHDYYNIVKDQVANIGRKINKPFAISTCYNIKEFMFKLLRKTKNTYHALIESPTKCDPTILNKLNDYVNIDMQRFIVASHNETKFVGNLTYKALNNFEPGINYFENINIILESSKNSDLYIEI